MLWPEAMAGVVRPSACSNHPALGLRQRCPSLSQEGSFLHTLMTPRINSRRSQVTIRLESRLLPVRCAQSAGIVFAGPL
jgi:hypothetical protein